MHSMLLQALRLSCYAWIAYWSTCRVVVVTTDHSTRGGISHVRLGRIQRSECEPKATNILISKYHVQTCKTMYM